MEISPRVRSWWEEVQESLWFIPTVGTVACALLAFGLVAIDHKAGLGTNPPHAFLIYNGGAEGARGVLSAIAASIVTVTGTVFSIAIVAMQLASGQFTPRVLRHFTGDRANQLVLGVFIGTFTYCTLVLRSVRSANEIGGQFVPIISVSVAIVLALVCVALLIFFIHHAARSIQVSVILDMAADDTARLVGTLFRPEHDDPPLLSGRLPADEAATITAALDGYVQDVDEHALCGAATKGDLTIHVLAEVGGYVYEGEAIARIWPASISDDLQQNVTNAFVVGLERTLYHDVAFGVRQLADIALKALSPAVNDPTTATQAIDRIGGILVAAGRRQPPAHVLYVDDRPAVFLPSITFGQLIDLGFTQIRHYGAADVVLVCHLLRTLEKIAALVADAHLAKVREHGALTVEQAMQDLRLDADKAMVRKAACWIDSGTVS